MSYTCFTSGKKGRGGNVHALLHLGLAGQAGLKLPPALHQYKVAQAPQKPFRQPQPRTS